MSRARPITYEVTPTGCHVVTSHKPGTGGYVKVWTAGKLVGLHRTAWEKANGRAVTDGMHILHSCDNPPCINPTHLREGTAADNAKDATDRRRRSNSPEWPGYRGFNCWLHLYIVRSNVATYKDLAEHFGVSERKFGMWIWGFYEVPEAFVDECVSFVKRRKLVGRKRKALTAARTPERTTAVGAAR